MLSLAWGSAAHTDTREIDGSFAYQDITGLAQRGRDAQCGRHEVPGPVRACVDRGHTSDGTCGRPETPLCVEDARVTDPRHLLSGVGVDGGHAQQR